jgi:hypothetical protein
MADASSPWTLDGNTASLRVGSFSAVVKIDEPGLGVHGVCWDGQPITAVREWLRFAEARPLEKDQVRTIEDAYVRGRDLVAVYAETPGHPLRYVLYWRALGEEQLCGAAAGVDVVASVQTSVLDAKPAAYFSSQCSADDAWALGQSESQWMAIPERPLPDDALDRDERRQMAEGVIAAARASCDDTFLFELAESPWAYAEMIHPRDRILSFALVHPFAGAVLPGSKAAIDDASTLRGAGTNHHVLGLPLEKGVLLRARLRVLLLPRSDAQEIAIRSREQFERAELPLTT